MSEKSMSQLYREYRKEKIKENCIVFESLWGRSYSCNPAAFYEYICENHPEYECVWFLNDIETPVPGNAKKVLKKSEEYYHYLATAKYFVYNANFPYSFKKRDGQVVIQTMHGTPFKTFGLDVKEEMATDYEKMRVVKRAAVWDYLVAQGEFTKKMAWTWFRYNNNVLETGYPRTDVLYKTDEGKAEALRKEYGIPAGKKVILLTNAQSGFTRPELHLLGLDTAFDAIFISGDAGVKKPSPAFFGLLWQTGLRPEDSVMVGNDGRCDCRGAAEAGMDSFYIHTEQSPEDEPVLPKNCHRIRTLTDLIG